MNKNKKRPSYYEPRDGSDLTCEVIMDTLISKEILYNMPVNIQHCYTSLYKYVYRLFFKGDDNAHIKDLNKIAHLAELLKNFIYDNKNLVLYRKKEIDRCSISRNKYMDALAGKEIKNLFTHDNTDKQAMEAYSAILDITYYMFYSNNRVDINNYFDSLIKSTYILKEFKQRIKNSFYNSTNISRLEKQIQLIKEGKAVWLTKTDEEMEVMMVDIANE